MRWDSDQGDMNGREPHDSQTAFIVFEFITSRSSKGITHTLHYLILLVLSSAAVQPTKDLNTLNASHLFF